MDCDEWWVAHTHTDMQVSACVCVEKERKTTRVLAFILKCFFRISDEKIVSVCVSCPDDIFFHSVGFAS